MAPIASVFLAASLLLLPADALGPAERPFLKKLRSNPFTAIRNYVEEAPEKRHCECINWQDAYFKRGLTCGKAQEVHLLDDASEGPSRCTNFFERFDTNYCVNVGNAGRDDNQWCFVDSRCGALNGGDHIKGAELSWKICKDQDPRTREMSMEELVVLSKSQDIDLSLLTKMAFPILAQPVPMSERWMYAQRAWGIHDGYPNRSTAIYGLDQEQFDALNLIAKSKTPTIILNSDSATPPFGVVNGRRAYEIRKTSAKNRDLEHPSTLTKAFCLAGCSPWGWSPNMEHTDNADLSVERQNKDH